MHEYAGVAKQTWLFVPRMQRSHSLGQEGFELWSLCRAVTALRSIGTDHFSPLISGEFTPSLLQGSRLRLKRDGTCAETRLRLSPKRTSPFKSMGASVQSTADSRGVRIGFSNAGCTTLRGSVKSTGYPLHSPFSPSIPLPCVTMCHQVSNAL